MKVYQVGSAVRDRFIGLQPKDIDWVVVGSTPEEMLASGYKEVGAEFPVFLHPVTGEEYALARKEWKDGHGYKGFKCSFGPEVTLEEDLFRRDLRINAMAIDELGNIIDPFGGQSDLLYRRIRHVSPAFADDPLRVLRAARFAAQLGFYIDRETLKLMNSLVIRGELRYLTPERVWIEIEKALKSDKPTLFFKYLYDSGALKEILPELSKLHGVPQREEYHPEGCCWKHTMCVLREICKITKDPMTRFAALCHDLGKGTTPKEILPAHHEHELRSADMARDIAKKYKIPKEYEDLAYLSAKFHMYRLTSMKPKAILKLLYKMDFFRRPNRFMKYLDVLEADHFGHGDLVRPYPEKKIWSILIRELGTINNKEVIGNETRSHCIKQLIHNAKLRIVQKVMKNAKQTHSKTS